MTRDDELLAADTKARIEALDITRSFIVQAPAGSGKTELLIQRYLRLLATVDDPEEVVAITFTRKAAAEMRLRVLDSLRRAGLGDTPDAPHRRITDAAAREVLGRDRERDWRIVANPRRMRIQTLDSLNASIARMQPLTGPGASASNPVPDEAEMKRLYRRAAAATFDWLTEPGETGTAVRELLTHVDNSTWSYVGYVSRMLETRDQWLPFVGTGRVDPSADDAMRRSLEARLETAVGNHLERCRQAVPAAVIPGLLRLARFAARNLREGGNPDHAVAALHDLDDLPGSRPDDVPEWLGLAELLLTQGNDWRRAIDARIGFPRSGKPEKQAFLALLEELEPHAAVAALLGEVRELPPVRYSDGQWSVLLALFHVLPVAVAELQRLFTANGVTDYIEIALSADNAIGRADAPGDVALLLDYQIRHVLVDEMQDTSRAQYRMLEALTGGWEPGDGRTLFCVGDPMQSIYRFRNADVSQFLLAQRSGIGSLQLETLLLRRNFRSGEYLVRWFNTVFPDVFPDLDDAALGAVAYAEAVPANEAAASCHVYPVIGPDVEEEAAQGQAVVERTLADHPGDDMAILARSRTQLAPLLARLRRAGIAYRAVEIDRLTDLPEIIDVLALTRAIAHDGDRLAWLSLLRAPWIGLEWRDLHVLVRNDTRSTVRELLADPERLGALSPEGRDRLAHLHPQLELMTKTSRSESLRDRVERTWLRMGGTAMRSRPHEIDNVYRFLDVLEKLESGGTLHDVAELEAQLDLERVSSNVDARVQVMTMHRAKGLQFDHVMLYGLGRFAGRSRKSVLSWIDLPDAHGAEARIISPVGPQADIENDPIHRYIERTEAARNRQETVRLLYVACTRARKSLHLVGHVKTTADGERLGLPDSRSLLRLLEPAVAPQYEQAFGEGGHERDAAATGLWRMPELRRIGPPWRCPEVAAVPGAGTAADVVATEPVDYHWVGAEARLAGTIVHRWLQAMADDRGAKVVNEPRDRRPVTERWLCEAGADPASMPAVLERVEAALAGVLADERGNWLIAGDGHVELALSGVVDGRLRNGVIDRVRIDADGTHWVVDYKTSSHEGGNLAGFLAAEAGRYRDQLRRYGALYRAWSGATVRCALYFPLLQEFVEVDT